MKRYALAVLLAVLGGLWFPLSVEAAEVPSVVIQQITADSRTSRTIVWLSDQSFRGVLEYRQPGGKVERVQAKRLKISAAQEEKAFRYVAVMQGLKPGQVYEYRVKMGRDWSEWYLVKTENGGPFKALVFPDAQCVDYAVWKKTAQLAYQRNADVAVYINMGDLVDNGEHWCQWKAWLQGVQGIAERIPFAPVEGNHEAYSLEWKFTLPVTYLQLFSLPLNGPEGLEGQVYSYDYGKVHFMVLDTQAEELAAFQPDLLERQATWLENELAHTQQPWKVVLMHKPPYGYPAADETTAVGKAFMSIFEQYQADVVLYAHLHCYCWTDRRSANARNSHRTVYICTGRAGDDAWNGRKREALDQVYFDMMEQPNYLTLEAAANQLEIRCFLQDGTEIDRVVLEKQQEQR